MLNYAHQVYTSALCILVFKLNCLEYPTEKIIKETKRISSQIYTSTNTILQFTAMGKKQTYIHFNSVF